MALQAFCRCRRFLQQFDRSGSIPTACLACRVHREATQSIDSLPLNLSLQLMPSAR